MLSPTKPPTTGKFPVITQQNMLLHQCFSMRSCSVRRKISLKVHKSAATYRVYKGKRSDRTRKDRTACIKHDTPKKRELCINMTHTEKARALRTSLYDLANKILAILAFFPL